MSSSNIWVVHARKRAQKIVARAPRHEQERLREALRQMETTPFIGDVVPLKNERSAFRRRVGDWRIFFDVYPDRKIVEVVEIARRTTTTYRGR